MTLDFLAGIFCALVPSMLAVAWFVWRETPEDSNFERRTLDRQLN